MKKGLWQAFHTFLPERNCSLLILVGAEHRPQRAVYAKYPADPSIVYKSRYRDFKIILTTLEKLFTNTTYLLEDGCLLNRAINSKTSGGLSGERDKRRDGWVIESMTE